MNPQPPTPTLIQLSLPPEQLARLAEIDQKLTLMIQRNNAETWLTDELVAERFHCSTSTIQRWRKDANLPFRQLGEKRLYVPAEVGPMVCELLSQYARNWAGNGAE